MKAQELRIGNYYLDINDRLSELGGWDLWQMCVKEDRGSLGVMEYQPIPLTEDWLLKFGFKKWKNKNNWSINSVLVYTIKNKGFCYGKKSLRVHIEYVHQLQNLYFALTNEELTIKQP